MITINERKIDASTPPYLIAELSANHNGSLDRAKLSIKIAKDCGVDAVKIQTYSADTMTINCDRDDFIIKGGLWNGYKLYDLYREAYTPYEWHSELFRYAKEIGITLFSSPFDETAVDLLESLNTPAYKIASFELTDLPLISYVAKKKKPILMSTGMANEEEISEAIETARIGGCNSLLLFHCISSYPTPIDQANLNQITNLKKKFGVSIGLSDHTIGNTCAIAAVALGACAIEKHFTLSREEKSHDSQFSIEPSELIELVDQSNNTWKALGEKNFIRPESELGSKVFRRSIYFVTNLKSGEKITSSSIRRIRPGFGIPSKHFDELIGMTVIRDVARGEPVSWDILKGPE
jgi:N-acetylneuraminate synthase